MNRFLANRLYRHVSRGLLLTYLTACSFAPPQHRPDMPIPTHYKEAVHWVMIKPSLAKEAKHCLWWSVFHDPVLNDLEDRLTRSNPTLNLAFARFQEARALAQAARSQLYPTILGIGAGARQTNSNNVANVYTGTEIIYDTFSLQGLLSYEIDVWGQIRNSIAASTHAARASEYDMAAVDLSLHATLAEMYFELKGENEEQLALDKIVAAYEHALFLVHQLHIGGAASEFDETQAINLVEQAKTAATNMRLSRAKLEHGLAVLVGDIPAHFKVSPQPGPMRFVAVSPQLPSSLVLQRPDVASAMERVQSANASIGVARAAFFPTFTLTMLVGLQAQSTAQLFTRPSLIWGLGPASGINLIPPQVSQVIFDGYLLQANLKQAKASYYEAVNNYRQMVLTAFKDVEDGLVETHRIHQEIMTQRAATKASYRSLYQVNQRMVNGMDTYLNVVGIENEALQNKLSLIQLNIQGQLASIHLIKALGGGWNIEHAAQNPI